MSKIYYQDEIIKIINNDCLSELKEIYDDSIDLVLTSPPYNKNGLRGRKDKSRGKGRWQGSDIFYGMYEDNMDEEDYKKWQIDILDECYRIMKPTGSIFYNHKVRRANKKASHPFEWISKSKPIFYQQIIWNRVGGPDHNVNYLDPTTELIFWLIKESPKFYKNKKYNSEIWDIIPEKNTKHPAPFPLLLCKVIILMTTDENDIVLDPFVGSGTVAIACKQLNRRCVGIELNKQYCDMTMNRLKEQMKQPYMI